VQHCNSITILLLSLANGDKIERSAKLSKCIGLLVQMYQGTKPVLPTIYILLSMADDNKNFALVYEVKMILHLKNKTMNKVGNTENYFAKYCNSTKNFQSWEKDLIHLFSGI